jgi:hypothetical protein
VTFHSRLLDWFETNRHSFPSILNRVIDCATDFIRREIFRRLKSAQINGTSQILPPSPVVSTAKYRVLIAPANYAGQGHAWAQAINESIKDAAAANLSIKRANDFDFSSDASVSQNIQQYSREWQTREAAYIPTMFTHVLIEAESAIFGFLFGNSPEQERIFFSKNGVSTAYVCHGSDIRSPQMHRTTTKFSPFADARAYNSRTQRRVDKNRDFLQRCGSPVFVSTPDLINDYPNGIWLPVVIDLMKWSQPSVKLCQDEREMKSVPPLVIHIPSKQRVKGSHLIEAPVARLVDSGVVRYQSVTGVSSEEVRKLVFGADIILDQFRLGSYGVAACEAMAAGKAVVGHVTPRVRLYILQQTGMELPIVEADPDSLAGVLAKLASDPARIRELGDRGQEFVAKVHSGQLSAQIIQQHWLHT